MPEQRVLLTRQRNQLYHALEIHGFSPRENFSLSESPLDSQVILKHTSTGYAFGIQFDQKDEDDRVVIGIWASPGGARLHETWQEREWSDVLDSLRNWLDYLSGELCTPDLWATISGDTQLIKLAADQDNRPFTPDDQLQFKKALDEIKAYLIKSHNLTGARLETVEGRLSYLEEAVTRMGRKDVIHIAIGVLANIATGLLFDADGTRELFRFAGQIFKQFLGNVYYLVGPH